MIVWTLFTLSALAALLTAEFLGARAGIWLVKPLASAGFLATALAAGAAATAYGRAVLAALALSFAGDVLLIPRREGPFRAGLVAFLLGHVAYAAAFVLRGADATWTTVALAALSAPAIAVGRWLLPRVRDAMRAPVLAYMVTITTMVALAAGTVGAHGRPLILAAAVAFWLSDVAVARDRFVAPGFANRAWGLPLYYGAQLMFAWSAA